MERYDPDLEEMPRRNHIGVGRLAALVSYERTRVRSLLVLD